MFKFFVTKKQNNYFPLSRDIIKHIKVVKIQKKPFVCVYEKHFYLCKLENNKAKIINKMKQNNEYEGNIILAIALIDKKRFEWLIEKATELGVKVIIPMLSQNVSQKTSTFGNKLDRFRIILKSAAQQSFRNIIPILTSPQSFNEVINIKIKNKFLAYAKSSKVNVNTLPTNSIFLIGPEGGFTKEEVKLASNRGFSILSLGKTILKSETAALCLLSKLNE